MTPPVLRRDLDRQDEDAGEGTEVDDNVFLLGRPPLREFLGYVKEQTVEGRNADLTALTDEWRRANDHVKSLEDTEGGLADNPPILPVPGELENLEEAAVNDLIIKRSYAGVPYRIGYVDLDRLVVFQKQINLKFIRLISEKLGPKPSDEEIFRLCIPIDHPVPPVKLARISQNQYAFISPSNDLRFLEPVMLDPTQVHGYDPQGPMVGVVGLVVGFGSNCLSAVQVDNRLILNNGSHRAYALREMGYEAAPCIIKEVTRHDELEVVGPAEVAKNIDPFLKAPRPPLLKDYFDPQLRQIVHSPTKNRQVRLTFGVEQLDAPAI